MIRLARPDDAPALAQLAEQTFVEAFVHGVEEGGFALGYPEDDLAVFLQQSYATERVAQWIADPAALVLIAERGGRAVAYAHAGDNTLPYPGAGPGDGELKRIYVRKSAQGIGLGRMLLEQALTWLGARPVYIGVWSGNHKAQRLYGHYGFRTVGAYQFSVGATLDDEVIMGRAASAASAFPIAERPV